MAALTTEQRADAMRRLVHKMFVESNETAQLTTVEVRQLVDDLDDFLEANATAVNNAIRVGLRTKATTTQKALAVAYVALKRAGAI